jgi:hypothetical protein
MLPQGTEPLVLADGTRINPIDGTVVTDEILVEVPNTEQIKREVVASRKRISDLPVPPSQMNTISVIISYTLFGISNEDISTVLALPLQQVIDIKKSDVYHGLQEQFLKNILESDLSDVRGLFVQKSRHAADRMFELLDSESESTRGVAAKDVLDRAGQRPVDVVEHRHKMEGGLTIRYIDQRDEHIPIIDITPDGEM